LSLTSTVKHGWDHKTSYSSEFSIHHARLPVAHDTLNPTSREASPGLLRHTWTQVAKSHLLSRWFDDKGSLQRVASQG